MLSLKQHLQERHLNFELHRPYIDETDGVVTFLLWNLSGNIIGYHAYRPAGTKSFNNNPKLGKYFTRKLYPSLTMFGIESLYLTPNIVFLVEGVFDATRLTNHGYSALAVLTNDPPNELANWLTCLNRRVIAVCDGDHAGQRLAKFGDIVELCEPGEDLSSSSDEFVGLLVNKYQGNG